MSSWSAIDAAANVVMQQTFGEPVAYQPVQAGTAVGDPLTITAVRHARVREESGALANFEEISVNPPDLPNPPVKGDWVTTTQPTRVSQSVLDSLASRQRSK